MFSFCYYFLHFSRLSFQYQQDCLQYMRDHTWLRTGCVPHQYQNAANTTPHPWSWESCTFHFLLDSVTQIRKTILVFMFIEQRNFRQVQNKLIFPFPNDPIKIFVLENRGRILIRSYGKYSLSVCKFISYYYLNICPAQHQELISFCTPYSSFHLLTLFVQG